MKKIGFVVEGMKCGGCKGKIESSLNENSDISQVEVNLEENTVILECSEGTSVLEIKKQIEGLGFVIPRSLRV